MRRLQRGPTQTSSLAHSCVYLSKKKIPRLLKKLIVQSQNRRRWRRPTARQMEGVGVHKIPTWWIHFYTLYVSLTTETGWRQQSECPSSESHINKICHQDPPSAASKTPLDSDLHSRVSEILFHITLRLDYRYGVLTPPSLDLPSNTFTGLSVHLQTLLLHLSMPPVPQYRTSSMNTPRRGTYSLWTWVSSLIHLLLWRRTCSRRLFGSCICFVLYLFICSNVKRPRVSWKALYKSKLWLLLLLLLLLIIIKSDVFLFVEVDVYHPLKRVPPLTLQSKSHSGLVSVQLCSSTRPSRLFRRFLTNLHNLAHICSCSWLPSLITVVLLCLERKDPRSAVKTHRRYLCSGVEQKMRLSP